MWGLTLCVPCAHCPAAQEAGKDHGEGGEDAWRAALLRARGEKVLDDPRLLRRSAKREAKAKAKRKQAWQQRTKQQADEQASRQQRYAEYMGPTVSIVTVKTLLFVINCRCCTMCLPTAYHHSQAQREFAQASPSQDGQEKGKAGEETHAGWL